MGSSPLARGTRAIEQLEEVVDGLIPARAGNTSGCVIHGRWSRAHPRSRGEHRSGGRRESRHGGSSPLARGTHYTPACRAATMGLIPARAGNTPGGRLCCRDDRAHPRSRGEHRSDSFMRWYFSGSSPLARGTPRMLRLSVLCLGLIPARAGNTLADMGVYPLHQQNRITLEPEPTSRIHDKQLLLTTTSTAILTRLTPP